MLIVSLLLIVKIVVVDWIMMLLIMVSLLCLDNLVWMICGLGNWFVCKVLINLVIWVDIFVIMLYGVIIIILLWLSFIKCCVVSCLFWYLFVWIKFV